MRSRLSAILSLSLKQHLILGCISGKWVGETEGGCCEELMIAEITKLLPYKESQTEGVYLTIQMKDIKTGKFLETFIVPGYRNSKKWQKVARVGNMLTFWNLKMKSDNLIDADTTPMLLTGRRKKIELMPTEKIKKTINEELFGPGYQP